MHQPNPVAGHLQALSQPNSIGQPFAEKSRLDPGAFLEGPGPRPHARGRAEGGPGEEAALVTFHTDGLGEVGSSLEHGRIEHPGMAAQQGAFAAFPQADHFHSPIVGGSGNRKNVLQDMAGKEKRAWVRWPAVAG